jgi:small conductance mechanosensitive channel
MGNPEANLPIVTLEAVVSALVVTAVELGILALVFCALYGLLASIRRRALVSPSQAAPGFLRERLRPAGTILVATLVVLVLGILAYNGWLVARGVEVTGHTLGVLRSITIQTWTALGIALMKLGVALVAFLIATRSIRRLLRWVEEAISRWNLLEANDRSLSSVFTGLDRAIVNTGWLLLAVLASRLLAAPPRVTDGLLVVVRVYLVIAIGFIMIRATTVLVDTLDGISQRYARARGWWDHYEQMRPLVSTFRACLEYALWIGMASLVVLEIGSFRGLAAWGPRLMQAIGIFFLGRVVIELGNVEIGRRMLPPEGLDETERRRRATMVPLVRSTFTYAVFFGTAVLILGALGFNPMPFLAGAGILGLVVGFGAQALINDVVSGFFILFENIYLVGDAVEAAGAKGVVEAIEFRTTKIRDAEGRLHIIRNGDMKQVVNYSKDYTVAVVLVEVPYDADVRAVFGVLREAGERVRAEQAHVLAPTEIDGITGLGSSSMTVRTSTRVRPGRHEAVAAALRLAIKEAFDGSGTGAPRKGLIPEIPRGG